MSISKIILFIAVFFSLTCHANTQATSDLSKHKNSIRYALLVGVSSYPSLDEDLQLIGPKNDAKLMRQVLLNNGFNPENVTSLVSGGEKPTKEAIMTALQNIADKARKDDFVYLHFGGHGSQQLSAEGSDDEADGMDEIFLPANVGEWNYDIGQVKNAITDNEIGSALTAIRRKGAFVWVVFDSCHSGTMTRGAPAEGVRYRKVQPWQLSSNRAMQGKIRQQLADVADKTSIKSRGKRTAPEAFTDDQVKDEDLGGYVAFFAAQTTEVTPEMRLPRGDRKRVSHGLFSYAVAEILSSQSGISYRQAAQMILQKYATLPLNAPTPMFEGTGLDEPMLGSGQSEPIRQWPLVIVDGELTIPAGQLHQIGVGSLLVVVKSPGDKTEDAITAVEVVDSELFSSVLSPVSIPGMTKLKVSELPDNAYVRLVDKQLNMSLTVALPKVKATMTDAETRVLALLKKLQSSDNTGFTIRWVTAGKDADLRLALLNNQLWLLASGGELIESGARKSISIRLLNKSEQDIADALSSSLKSIAKVSNLLRLSTTMGDVEDDGIQLKFYTTAKCRQNEANCIPGEREVLPGQLAQTLAKDKVRFVVKNNSEVAVDVTLLFIDGSYGISPYFPVRGRSNRIEAGASKEWKATVNAKTVGLEHMLVIAVQAEEGAEHADFTFLAQPALPRTRGVRRAGSQTLNAMFREAGFGKPRSRGLDGEAEKSKTSMRLFSWKVQPK